MSYSRISGVIASTAFTVVLTALTAVEPVRSTIAMPVAHPDNNKKTENMIATFFMSLNPSVI